MSFKTYRPVFCLFIRPPAVSTSSSSQSLIFSLLCGFFSLCHLGVVHIHLVSHYFCISHGEAVGGVAAALNRRGSTRHPAGSSRPLLSNATHVGPRRPPVLEPSSDGATLAVVPSVSLRAPRALSGRETCKRNCIDEASFLKPDYSKLLTGIMLMGPG